MDGIEYLNFELESGVCIFTIPPLSTSKGYFLDDWKQMIWEGGLKVVDKKYEQNVIFKNSKGEFARFIVPKQYTDAIQKTSDSSRGCAMRLVKPNNQGVFWIGVAFRDRNDCFNFIQVVSEYQDKKERELNPNAFQNEFKVQDFTLKEKIVFTEKGAKTVESQQRKPQADLKQFSFGNNPGQQQQQEPVQQQQSFAPQQQQQPKSNFNDFSDFGNFGSNQNTKKNNNNAFGDFSDFSNFGNSGNNNNSNQQQQNNFNNNHNNNFGQFGNQQQQQQQQNNNFGGNNNFGNNNNNFQQYNNNNNNNNNNQQGQSGVSENLLDL